MLKLKNINLKESTTNKMLLFASILSLILIYIYTTFFFEIPEKPINDITMRDAGNYYKVCGIISNLKEKPKYNSFYLCQQKECIKTIDFNNNKYKNNTEICIIGEVNVYKNQLELVRSSNEIYYQ